MHYLNIIREGLREKELFGVFGRGREIKEVQSEDLELENSLTFFNRIVQQVSAMERNTKHTQNCINPVVEEKERWYLQKSHALLNVDPIYTVECSKTKLLQYELEMLIDDKERLGKLEKLGSTISQQLYNTLNTNYRLLYEGYLQTEHGERQLARVSENIRDKRGTIKQELCEVLGKYQRQKSKALVLNQLRITKQFLEHFRQTLAVYSDGNRFRLFEKLVSARDSLAKLESGSGINISKIKCLNNIRSKCEEFIQSAPGCLSVMIDQSFFQKTNTDGIIDSVISDWVLQKLGVVEPLVNRVDWQVKTVLLFAKNPQSVTTTKDYLEMIVKYLRNLSRCSEELKNIRSSSLEEKISSNGEVKKHLNRLRDQIQKRLGDFYRDIFGVLAEVCAGLIRGGSSEDRKIIRRFVEVVGEWNHSEGMRDLKSKVKAQLNQNK